MGEKKTVKGKTEQNGKPINNKKYINKSLNSAESLKRISYGLNNTVDKLLVMCFSAE